MRSLCEVARRSSRVESVVVAAMLVAACGPRMAEVPGPPPIPEASGRLKIDVVYPPNGSLITVRDSNFIFGSVGTGAARLTINGRAVAVRPNGAFIAWLPVPASASGVLAQYELVATLGAEERRLTHTVRLLPAPVALAGDSAEVDVASLSPRGSWWVRRGEAITVRPAAPGWHRAADDRDSVGTGQGSGELDLRDCSRCS